MYVLNHCWSDLCKGYCIYGGIHVNIDPLMNGFIYELML